MILNLSFTIKKEREKEKEKEKERMIRSKPACLVDKEPVRGWPAGRPVWNLGEGWVSVENNCPYWGKVFKSKKCIFRLSAPLPVLQPNAKAAAAHILASPESCRGEGLSKFKPGQICTKTSLCSAQNWREEHKVRIRLPCQCWYNYDFFLYPNTCKTKYNKHAFSAK